MQLLCRCFIECKIKQEGVRFLFCFQFDNGNEGDTKLGLLNLVRKHIINQPHVFP